MSFLEHSADLAAECFDALGSDAVLITVQGIRTETRGAIKRSNQVEGHLGQASIVGTVPVCVGTVVRGDKLRCEGHEFEVVKELDRDQDVIWLQLKDLGPK